MTAVQGLIVERIIVIVEESINLPRGANRTGLIGKLVVHASFPSFLIDTNL
jgi:hypothetical protein